MKQTTFLFLPFLFSLMFAACGKDYTSDLETLQVADLSSLYEAGSGSTKSTSVTTIPMETASFISQMPEKDNNEKKSLPMMNVPTFGYYTLRENSPPLFSKQCLISRDPDACSVETLKEWLNDQLKNTDNGLEEGEFSIQYIVFEIDRNGKVFNVKHTGSDGNTFCWPCMKIAVETIKEMPTWTPATKDGKPVIVSLKLPVRFEVI